MTLNVNKEKLTILDVQFDNYEDFDAVWYAVGSSMIEDFTPTTESVLELKNYILKLKFVFLKMILYIIPIWTEPYMATYRN